MSEPINEGIPPIAPIPTPAEVSPPPPKGPWGFWATIGFSTIIAIGYLVGQFVAVILFAAATAAMKGASQLSADQLSNNGMLLGLGLIMSAPISVGLSWLFAWLRKGPPLRDYLGLCWPSGRQTLKWTLLFVGLMVASDWLTNALGRPIVPPDMLEIYRNTSFLPILWVGACVGAPLSEEVFFRGFLFRGLAASRLGGIGTILLTAATWASIHLQYDAYGIATIFVSGILLGFVRLKTGSVFLCVALHALMNVVATAEIPILYP